MDPNLYNVPEPNNGSLWFDGYRGQKTILLDDFYGWIKYHTLLQITDGYPYQAPTKRIICASAVGHGNYK